MFLAALEDGFAGEEALELPLGSCAARLLLLREGLLGSKLECISECPECAEQIEFSIDSRQLDGPNEKAEPAYTLCFEGWTLSFRLPNSADLLAASREEDEESARRIIFARCLGSASAPDGFDATDGKVPERVVREAAARMAEADPLADLSFALKCPDCGADWTAPFDAAGFVTEELQRCSSRLLQEVHELALAYGWGEEAILNLPQARRHAYLELLPG